MKARRRSAVAGAPLPTGTGALRQAIAAKAPALEAAVARHRGLLSRRAVPLATGACPMSGAGPLDRDATAGKPSRSVQTWEVRTRGNAGRHDGFSTSCRERSGRRGAPTAEPRPIARQPRRLGGGRIGHHGSGGFPGSTPPPSARRATVPARRSCGVLPCVIARRSLGRTVGHARHVRPPRSGWPLRLFRLGPAGDIAALGTGGCVAVLSEGTRNDGRNHPAPALRGFGEGSRIRWIEPPCPVARGP